MVRQSEGPKAPSATSKKYDLSIIFTKTTERAKPPRAKHGRAEGLSLYIKTGPD